jgi:hypothetical protein
LTDSELGVVERHHGNDRVKFAQAGYLLDALANQARMSWSRRVHAERVESQLSQAVNQPAIAAPDIENPGACWLQGSDNRVEVPPPSRIGHTPEPYPYRSRPR